MSRFRHLLLLLTSTVDQTPSTCDGLSSTALCHHIHTTSWKWSLRLAVMALPSGGDTKMDTTVSCQVHRNHRMLHECMHPAVVAEPLFLDWVEHLKIPHPDLIILALLHGLSLQPGSLNRHPPPPASRMRPESVSSRLPTIRWPCFARTP